MTHHHEENAYILGTDQEELHRLGLQHQVWASEARKGWEIAEFTAGQTILDLGCGPGFCTTELAYMVGASGKVIGVDKSNTYINFLQQLIKQHGLNIELRETDFDNMQLEEESLDGVYDRWALAWIPNPEEIIAKLVKALKPGGAIVAHEYYHWGTFQVEPHLPALQKGINSILKGFKESDGEIDIGKYLPNYFEAAGLEVISIRPMAKLALPGDMVWQWPKSFLQIYMPKINNLAKDEIKEALKQLEELENMPGATILTPLMVEVIAVKL